MNYGWNPWAVHTFCCDATVLTTVLDFIPPSAPSAPSTSAFCLLPQPATDPVGSFATRPLLNICERLLGYRERIVEILNSVHLPRVFVIFQRRHGNNSPPRYLCWLTKTSETLESLSSEYFFFPVEPSGSESHVLLLTFSLWLREKTVFDLHGSCKLEATKCLSRERKKHNSSSEVIQWPV